MVLANQGDRFDEGNVVAPYVILSAAVRSSCHSRSKAQNSDLCFRTSASRFQVSETHLGFPASSMNLRGSKPFSASAVSEVRSANKEES